MRKVLLPCWFGWFGRLGMFRIEVTPADLRTLLRLAASLAAWKLLSTDYSALATLVQGPDLVCLPAPLSAFSPALKWLCASKSTIIGLQALSVVGLALFIARWGRLPLICGILPAVLLEWGAYHYRGTLLQLDLPLALLTIAALYPARLSAVRGLESWHQRPAGRSLRFLAVLLVIYLANTYWLAGLSKLLYDTHWCQTVGLECLYPFAQLSYLGEPPGLLRDVAYTLNCWLAACPALGQALAWATLIAELGWPLVLVNRYCRRIIPVTMAAIQVGIFLCGGPLFLSMALLQLSVAIRWDGVRAALQARLGTLLPWQSAPAVAPAADGPGEASGCSAWRRALEVAALAAIGWASFYPALSGRQLFPFADYCCFGWSYRELLQASRAAYALGYLDRASGTIRPLPPNHGGFLDFRLLAGSSLIVAAYCKTPDPEQRQSYARVLLQYQRALRWNHSNGKLLGALACPDNMLLRSPAVERAAFTRLYLLRGKWHLQDNHLIVNWQVYEALPSPAEVVGAPPLPRRLEFAPPATNVFKVARLAAWTE